METVKRGLNPLRKLLLAIRTCRVINVTNLPYLTRSRLFSKVRYKETQLFQLSVSTTYEGEESIDTPLMF
jgi:hypothetical protein